MCRMILALGEFDSLLVVNGLKQMSSDQTKAHEYNKGKLGTWLHTDGWGALYKENNSSWKEIKSINPFVDDVKTQSMLDLKTNAMIIHSRRGTVGSIDILNTHPFSCEYQGKQYYLFHNGSVKDTIGYDSIFELKGKTDSEQLFYSILSKMQKMSLAKAMNTVLLGAKKTKGNNLILVVDNTIYIATSKYEGKNYYQMSMFNDSNKFILSSEIIESIETKNHWRVIEENAVYTIDIESRSISRVL